MTHLDNGQRQAAEQHTEIMVELDQMKARLAEFHELLERMADELARLRADLDRRRDSAHPLHKGDVDSAGVPSPQRTHPTRHPPTAHHPLTKTREQGQAGSTDRYQLEPAPPPRHHGSRTGNWLPFCHRPPERYTKRVEAGVDSRGGPTRANGASGRAWLIGPRQVTT
jgi:hypothetical protein